MAQKADSWKQYGQAALIEQVIASLPEVANAVAQPLAKTDRIVVISTGASGNEGAGASRVTRDVTNTIAQLPDLIEALTGIDILGTLKNLPGVLSVQGPDSMEPMSGNGVGAEPESVGTED